MALSEGQRKILDIIAGLTGRTLSTSTMDAVVVDKSGLPEEEVRNYKPARCIRLYYYRHQGFRRRL